MSTPAVHPLNGSQRLEDLSRDELLELLEARGEGGIRIDFSGKTNARKLARRVRPRVSRTIKKYSAGSDNDQARNLVIEGDNLQAMATLYRERGHVDLILTDPPYNTGRDWRYNDRWEKDPNDPGIGEWVELDDGDRHTKWMRFMWPRLQMMREMLKPTGVLAICIDHRELFRLGAMLDELFKEENRLGIINWQKSYSPRNDNTHLSTATEYVLVYARDEGRAKTSLLDRTEGMDARYTNPDKDPEGLWTGGDPTAGKGAQNPPMVYGIQSPFTGELQWPQESDCWRSPKRDMKTWLEEWGSQYEERDIADGKPSIALVLKGARIVRKAGGPQGDPADPVVKRSRKRAQQRLAKDNWPRLIFLKQGEGRPRLKRYLTKVKQGVVPMTFWADEDYDDPFVIGSTSWEHPQSGHSQTGINELDAILGKGHQFSTVKPLKLMQKIVQLWCPPDGLVVDPFAGSGTTGHAVLQANEEAGASRRFVMIERGRPDRGDSYTRSLTAARLQRVISGDWKTGKHEPLGGGYRFCALDVIG